MAISQRLTFTIWMLKLQRGLGLSLIRSCGAKSNQSKREQRAKPSPVQTCVCCLLRVIAISTGLCVWRLELQSKATSLPLPVHFFALSSCLSCIFFSSQGKREWEGWRVFALLLLPLLTLLNLDKSIWYRRNLLISSWHYHCSPSCGGTGPAPLA